MNSVSHLILKESVDKLDCVKEILLSEADRYIFWIGGSLTLIATFFVILSSWKFKEVRKQPGDLILGIVLSDFALSLHWIIIATWHESVDNNIFCVGIGIFGVFAGINEFLYNISFSLYLIITLRSTLKQSRIPKRRFHIFNLSLSFIALIYLLSHDGVGKTLAGTCSLKEKCTENSHINFGLIIALVYAAIGAYTYYYVKKNVPKCQRAHKKRTAFLLYYLKYIVASSVIYTIIAIFSIINTVIGNKHNIREENAWINSIFNIVKLCSPLVLSFIRYGDPFLRKAMIRTLMFWKKLPLKSERNKTELLLPKAKENPIELGNMSPIAQRRFQSTVAIIPAFEVRGSYMSSSSRGSIEEFVVNDLSTSKKMEFTYTLLSCLLYAHHLEHQSSLASSQTYERKKNNPYSHQVVYSFDEECVKSTLPAVKANLERTRYRILPGSLKVYCPEIFTSLLFEDRDYLDVMESLDFDINREQMKAATAGAAQGGKSGEFFFFSADKKLILKTVPDSEMRMLIKILAPLREHFNNNPNSLIAKIYAAVTYENTDEKLKFNLVLMKNVNGFPSKYVERVYDLKGSKYDREVLKDEDIESRTELKKFVLKDLDFIRFEQNLHIKQEFKKNFLRQIEIDSSFFRENYLIDYSFMVFYVNKRKYFEDVGPFHDFTARNPLASLENTQEPGMYYNIGIIDYLQPYSIKKILEKYFKRLRAWDSKLETSTQDPNYYSERFIKFIKRIAGE